MRRPARRAQRARDFGTSAPPVPTSSTVISRWRGAPAMSRLTWARVMRRPPKSALSRAMSARLWERSANRAGRSSISTASLALGSAGNKRILPAEAGRSSAAEQQGLVPAAERSRARDHPTLAHGRRIRSPSCLVHPAQARSNASRPKRALTSPTVGRGRAPTAHRKDRRMPLYSFEGKSPRVHPTAFIAPTAALIGDVTVEENASVWYNAVVRADFSPIVIRRGANIQDCAVLHVTPVNGVELVPGATLAHH